ncbi:MAG: NAD(P)/FAD-dependent oxidoreductase [Clostridia bacterium]|nr:NAD(P)/FAD-dependent oxidoreductase [Clostridia bacterium]
MENEYDVIVVGAGNGGLVTAATTAKAGLKTLVLEKHNLPGGCATSFIRGRFEFEPSLHELSNLGTEEKPMEIYNILSGLGVKIDWQYESNVFRAILRGENGYDVTIPSDKKGFIDAIDKAAQGSRESLENMFALIDVLKDAMAYIDANGGKINPVALYLKFPDFVRCAGHSVDDVLTALKMPEKAKQIIGTYWSYLGVPTDELNAMHFLLMLDGYISARPAMPLKRAHQISVSLAQIIMDNGGVIKYNTPVTEFLYDAGGACYGVIADGKEYRAKKIVANIIPNAVFGMSKGNVPKYETKLCNARTFGISILTVYIGLDCTAEELGIKDYTIFVYNTPDTRAQNENRKDLSLYIVNCLNTVIPDCTPEGTSTLFFAIPVYGDDIPDDLEPQDYKKYKNEIAKKYIEDFERVLGVSILPHIEEISIATPVTFARYLGTPGGTIYGYYCADWDSVIMRTMNSEKDHTIENLYFVGGHAERGDGFSSAYLSGDEVGRKIIKLLGEEE